MTDRCAEDAAEAARERSGLTEESIRLPHGGYRMSELARLPRAEKEKALARLIREACKPIPAPDTAAPNREVTDSHSTGRVYLAHSQDTPASEG